MDAPDAEGPKVESGEAQDRDAMLDAALEFTATYPVFSARQLYTHLSGLYPLQPDLDRAFARQLVQDVLAAHETQGRQAQWHCREGGYEGAWHCIRIVDPEAGELPTDMHDLEQSVVAELDWLFAGRDIVTYPEIMFYIETVLGIGRKADKVLGELVKCNLLTRLSLAEFALPTKDGAEPVLVPGKEVKRRRRAGSPTAPPSVREKVMIGAQAEALARRESDLEHGGVVLDRLCWHTAQNDGVRLIELISWVSTDACPPRRAIEIVDQLHTLGYIVVRENANPQDILVLLGSELAEAYNRDMKAWPAIRTQALEALPTLPTSKPDARDTVRFSQILRAFNI